MHSAKTASDHHGLAPPIERTAPIAPRPAPEWWPVLMAETIPVDTRDRAWVAVRDSSLATLGQRYDLIDREIKQRLERLPGIARVDINGAAPNEVEIAVDPDRLTAHGLSLNDLAGQLAAVNFSVSAGERPMRAQNLRAMRAPAME